MTASAGTKIALVFLVAALTVACGGKSVNDSIASAKQFMAKRDHAAAVIELKSALQQSPNSGEARFLLGTALLEQGNPLAALLEFGKAQDQGFNDELLASKIARAWLATGKFKEVAQTYTGTTLKLASAQAELSTAVGVAHARLNQRAEADAAIAYALKVDPKYPWALVTKARFEAAAGRFDDALTLVEQAIVPGAPNGDAYLLRGTILRFSKKDTEGAGKAYEQAALDPQEEVSARGALIQMFLQHQKLVEAKAQLAKLQGAHAKNPRTLYLAAVLAYSDKDYARTAAIAEQLLRLTPNSPQLLVLGGAANLQQGDLIAAETKLGKVVQTVERAFTARKLLAETYLRMGQPEKSLTTLRPLLERAEPDGDALALAGQAYLQTGNMQNAETAFAAALKLNPQGVSVRTALALADLAKGNADAAFAELQDIAAKDSGKSADMALISAHLRRREYDQALAAIALLEAKLPNKAATIHLRGVALRGKGDLTGARTAFEAALKLEPANFASVAWLASLDLQERKPEAAKKRLEAAIKLNPQNTSARLALFDLMLRQGAKPEELLANIEDAIRAAPADAAPRVAKVSLLSGMNDIKAAALAAQNAIAALPQNPDVLDVAGRALSKAGDEQQALLAFNKLADVSPRSALPYLRMADLYSKRGDLGAASSSLARAFEAEPGSEEVHKRLLSQASKSKDYKPVIKAGKELQERRPTSAVGFLLEGDAETARKGWPRALVAYRAALHKADGNGRPQKMVYWTLRASGDATGAERFASDWMTADPKEVEFARFLAGEALLRKDFVIAERYYRKVLAAEPKSTAAMNNIAWSMSERGAAGAVEMAERALASAPTAAPVMDTLAKALASDGQFDRALQVQKKAIAAMPDRQHYRLSLIRLYIKAGKKAEAAAELDALLKQGEKRQQFPAELAELRKELGR